MNPAYLCFVETFQEQIIPESAPEEDVFMSYIVIFSSRGSAKSPYIILKLYELVPSIYGAIELAAWRRSSKRRWGTGRCGVGVLGALEMIWQWQWDRYGDVGKGSAYMYLKLALRYGSVSSPD